MDVNGSTLTISIYHFSGGGAGRNPAPLPTPGSAQGRAEQSIAILLNNRNNPPGASDIANVLLTWYNATVKPGLQGATTALDPLRPRIKSPSQWPGTARSSTSVGRSEIITMFGILPRTCRASSLSSCLCK